MKQHKVIVKEGKFIKSIYFNNYVDAKTFYENNDTAIAFYPYDKKTGSIALVSVKNV